MIRLAVLVFLVIVGVRLFNSGLTVDVNGKTHSIKVSNGTK